MSLIRQNIQMWASRGLYEKSDELHAQVYVFKELQEFLHAEGEYDMKMEAGDVIVTLINCQYLKDQTELEPTQDLLWNQSLASLILERTLEGEYGQAVHAFIMWLDRRHGFDWEECLRMATEKNAKRTGSMKHGEWVKEDEVASDDGNVLIRGH